jgi:integrase
MASVRKLKGKNGAIVYQARWRQRAGGRWLDRAKNFDRAAAAREYAARMEMEIERAQVGDPDRMSTAVYFERYLAALETEGERSEVTVAVYRKALNWAARELGHVPLAKLNVGHIDDCYAALMQRHGLSRQTVRLVHRCLSSALRQARRRRLIASNPCEDASPPAPTSSRVKAFAPAQVQALLRAAESTDPETHAIVCVLLTTGLRRGELAGLKVDDIDGEVLVVRRTVVEAGGRVIERERGKSKAAMRTISIPSALVEILRVQRKRVLEQALAWGAGWERPLRLFPGLGGKPMAPQMLTRRMRALLKVAGISGPSPTHAWRHTCGSVLYGLTKDVKVVQQRLGHTRASTTMDLYVHSSAERDQEAAVHLGRLIEPK